MAYHEPKDIRTGVAIKHSENAKKSKGITKTRTKVQSVDWRNSGIQYLQKIASGYNPFQIEVKGKWYELKGIAAYDSNGVVIKTSGWFGSNNDLEDFPVPEAIRRLKPKFNGETFIMPVKKDSFDRSDRPYADLYIPIDYFDFRIEEGEEDWGSGQRVKFIYYTSKSFYQDPNGTPLVLKERIGKTYRTSKGEKILAEIAALEKEIEKKKLELSKA